MRKFKHGMSEQEKREHKLARKMRRNARGKQWQLVGVN